jgi:hypothetical protein
MKTPALRAPDCLWGQHPMPMKRKPVTPAVPERFFPEPAPRNVIQSARPYNGISTQAEARFGREALGNS